MSENWRTGGSYCPYKTGELVCNRARQPGSMWCPKHAAQINAALDKHEADADRAQAQAAEDQAMRYLDSTVHETARRQSNFDHRDDSKPWKMEQDHQQQVPANLTASLDAAAAQVAATTKGIQDQMAVLDKFDRRADEIAARHQGRQTYQQTYQQTYRPQRPPGHVFHTFVLVFFCLLAVVAGFIGGFIIGAILAAMTGVLALGYLCVLGGMILGPVLVVSYCRGEDHRFSQMSSHERSDELWRREYRRRTRIWGYGMWRRW